MRKANMRDMFRIARILNDLDMKDTLFRASKQVTEEKETDIEKVGFNIIFDMTNKAFEENTELAIYECVAMPFEMSKEEVGNMAFLDFAKTFIDCFDIVGLLNFIRRAEK